MDGKDGKSMIPINCILKNPVDKERRTKNEEGKIIGTDRCRYVVGDRFGRLR